MFIYKNGFEIYTDENQPYSIMPEKTHKYSNYDGYVKDGVFFISRQSTNQILLMEKVESFELSANISYVPPIKIAWHQRLGWGITVGYDIYNRAGIKIVIDYTPSEKKAEIILLNVDGIRSDEISRKAINEFVMNPYDKYALNIVYDSGTLKVSLNDNSVCFKTEIKKGVITLSKEHGAGETGFSDLLISGIRDEIKNIYKQKFIMPRTDGGSFDYSLSLSINKLNNSVFEIKYSLDGGVFNQHGNFHKCDSWLREHDIFWNLYFSFGKEKYYINRGQLTFVDSDYINCTEILDGSQIPFCGQFNVQTLDEIGNVFIGYDRRFSHGCGNMVSDRMFTYSKDGDLLYVGKSLDKDCFFEVKSNDKKEITKRIPKDISDYDDTVFFAENNHYFFTQETPKFKVYIYSKIDMDFLKVGAELQNVWFEKIESLDVIQTNEEKSIFEKYGYKKYCFSVECNVHKQGVYHLKISCICGNSEIYKHTSAFEVIDELLDETPQETVGLPMIYSGDGHLTKYSGVDFSVRRPDFNILHYIDSSLVIPKYSEDRKIWKLLKLYKRKFLVWMTFRTLINRDETYENYPGTVKNADYLCYIYPGIEDSKNYYRYDLWMPVNLDAKYVKNLYKTFLKENEDLRDVFPEIGSEGAINEEKWAQIPGEKFNRWITYINGKTAPLFTKQWDEIKKINPKLKRFSYGPYNVYNLNNSGAYDTKWYGFSNDGLKETFGDGFLQFEDYPFACGYQTHISAWNMATIKLEWENVRISPELYDSMPKGCPDGAVAFANPPLGSINVQPYQTITQLYEYLYNTAIFENGRFRYWTDKILMMTDYVNLEPEKRYKIFLKAWRNYLNNKPKNSLGRIAYITEYDSTDDKRAVQICNNAIYNLSQAGMSVVHEVCAENGLPQGFVMKFNEIERLSSVNTDLIIIPSLLNVDDSIKNKIRELYNSGVSLIAVSDVSGLEDVFGVEKCEMKKRISKLCYKGKDEIVYPYTAEIRYRATEKAKSLVLSDDCSIICRKNNAFLINCSLSEVGIDSFPFATAERANISSLIKEAIADYIKDVTEPQVCVNNNCGVVFAQTENDEYILLLTDYSPYKNITPYKVNVKFNGVDVKGIEFMPYDDCDIEINVFNKQDMIDGFSVKIRPHETLMFKLNV